MRAGQIGPNAILQMVPALAGALGDRRTQAILNRAGLGDLPDGTAMIPQDDAARLHGAVRREEPERATAIAREAGIRTADYILAHRIPKIAQRILKMLPAALAARALSRAIARHAWTFAGSGRFRAITPWRFEIHGNPLIAGEHAPAPLCAWHCAVFETLYRRLVAADARCMEVACGAASGDGVCRFVLARGGTADDPAT